jgi:serine/threonine-protein kinase PpkA
LALPSISIENFELLEPLGQGGMGSVYLAEQKDPRRQVAIRIIPPDLGLPEEFLVALAEEGNKAAQFPHPSIVGVHECGMVDGHYYLVMDYLSGGNLESRLDGVMDQDLAAGIVKAIGDALGHLHDNGYLHRNLKPGNILFNQKDKPILADFGTGREFDADGLMNRLGLASGTAEYLSPEQISGDPIDGRSDLYSLGTIFFQMLTGDLPFLQDGEHSLRQAKVSEPPARLPKHLRHYQIVLDRLLARSPDDRFDDSGKLQVALDFRLQSTGEFPAPHEEEVPEPVLETMKTMEYRIAMVPTRVWVVLAGIAVVVIIALWQL